MLSIRHTGRPLCYRWAAARVTGASHQASGERSQDALTLRTGYCLNHHFVVAALADGAGSAQFAEEAARFTTRKFTKVVAEEIGDWGLDGISDLMLDAAYGVHRSLRRSADHRGVHADEFATTLLAAVLTPELSAFLQIGDGGVATGPRWRMVFRPHRGRYHNEVSFLTDDDAPDRFQQTVHEGCPEFVALFTDGMEDLLVEPSSLAVHPPLLDYVASNLAGSARPGLNHELSAQLTNFFASGEVRSRTSDDTTLLAIHAERATP